MWLAGKWETHLESGGQGTKLKAKTGSCSQKWSLWGVAGSFFWLSRSVDKYNSVWFTSVYTHTTHIKLTSFGWVPYIFTKAFLVTSWRIASIMTYDCKEEGLVWNDQPTSYLKRFWEAHSSVVLDPFFYYARLISVEAMPQSPGRDSSEPLWEV